MQQYRFYIYIVTDSSKSTIYKGVTNDLSRRLTEHFENRRNPKHFAGRYSCYHLVYYEGHNYILNAISREKEIKKWRRSKKNALIDEFNPGWKFLNRNFVNEK